MRMRSKYKQLLLCVNISTWLTVTAEFDARMAKSTCSCGDTPNLINAITCIQAPVLTGVFCVFLIWTNHYHGPRAYCRGFGRDGGLMLCSCAVSQVIVYRSANVTIHVICLHVRGYIWREIEEAGRRIHVWSEHYRIQDGFYALHLGVGDVCSGFVNSFVDFSETRQKGKHWSASFRRYVVFCVTDKLYVSAIHQITIIYIMVMGICSWIYFTYYFSG